MRSLRFHLAIQLFGLLVITVNAHVGMTFLTAQTTPSSFFSHDHDDILTKHGAHSPNLRLEAVHVLQSMHSNYPDVVDDDNSETTEVYINPFSAMFQGMGVARDTKKLSETVNIKTALGEALRGVTGPPGSSKRIHCGLNYDELRSTVNPPADSNIINEKTTEVQGLLTSTTTPPGSSNSINSEGLIHYERNKLGRLRGSVPPHDSTKSIQSGLTSHETVSIRRLQVLTPPPGSSGTSH